MKFVVDENLGRKLALGMQGFGKDVEFLLEINPSAIPNGCPDTVWLPYVGNKGWFVITRDKHIRKRPAERKSIVDHRIGMFILTGKHLSAWDIIVQVVVHWQEIENCATRTQKPFAFEVPPKGSLRRVRL